MHAHPLAAVFLALAALAPRAVDAQPVVGVRFAAGSRAVALQRLRSITLYDRATTGDARIRVDTPWPYAAVWTDGRLAAPVEGAVRVFDLATGATTTSIPQAAAPWSLALDGGGGRLLVRSADDAARLYELPSGRALGELRGVRCAGLALDGEIVTADDRSVQWRAAPESPPRVVPLRGARASSGCSLARGATLLVAGASNRRWAYDTATGRPVLGPTAAVGDNLTLFIDALAGAAPVISLPGSSSRVASTLDLRTGRRVDARYVPPACAPTADARCPPPSHTYIVSAAARGDGVVSLGVRDVDDDVGRDTLFLVEGTGAVRVVADRVPESAYDALTPDGAWVVRLTRGSSPALELTPVAGGEARRAPCVHRHLALSPDGRTAVTWENESASLWRLDEPSLAPVPLR